MIEQHAATVTRTMRAAIKVGDNYFTVEECVTLPVGADDHQVAEAVATGLRIFQAQQSAIEEQISGLRTAPPAARTPNPASSKQLSLIERLAGALGHSLDSVADACGFSAAGLTSEQASQIIDAMKANKVAPAEANSDDADDLFSDTEPPANPDEPVPAASASQPITQAQQRAISALCQLKNVTIQQAISDEFQQTIALEHLSQQQAGSLIAALNARQPAAFIGATAKATSRRK